MEDIPIIKEGENVFIEMPSGNVKVVSLKANSIVNMGKFGNFQVNDLIGKPFGHSYEVIGKNKIQVTRHAGLSVITETTANNREIVDNNASQKLSQEDVEKLKETGLEGGAIVETLVENHASFEKKTEYSKAKYIKKKEKKFKKVFTPVKPNLYSLCDYFFKKNPTKIRDLRIDTLSQMLNMGNIRAHSKILVVDDTQGLVICGLMERMAGYGSILGIHDGDNHNYDTMRYMNFPTHTRDMLKVLSWAYVSKDSAPEPFQEQDTSAMEEREVIAYNRKKKAHERLSGAQNMLWEGDFDALLIASQYAPDSILEELLPYVAGSRPIVVYSPNKEVLVNTYNYMKKSMECLNPQITESWLREYQVLPGRTHPTMNTSGSGGYLLNAIKVIDCPAEPMNANRRKGARKLAKAANTNDDMKVDVETSQPIEAESNVAKRTKLE
ncbi:Gcd10p-domain-containing protein [Basidiobolus meristosporus CBS 931.73]|uniref:tRNA (adenine(58)-N(1))-methyltransferase non-catalytic subunit TRM6 n=1 Tax=Basidiobolus meristosporus CBS 931.73 TaxID=1314790 RepID=A0A1Y1XGU5_9FUNG|nr:Gcd10p-domain-containing protein [Basidiobolus meristosporus CBS 931.73]|eukprot:ORX84626.1 Gcd10p-domain-containing protein [Basidiobolus meristosporus CBS 931.73]